MALKISRLSDDVVRERFRREAQSLAGIRHPHLVQIYDHGIVADGSAYLVSSTWMVGPSPPARRPPTDQGDPFLRVLDSLRTVLGAGWGALLSPSISGNPEVLRSSGKRPGGSFYARCKKLELDLATFRLGK